jgi:anti-sigma B factor antagonist
MNQDIFKYKIYNQNPAISIVELGTKVLGGSDSITFNNLLDELISKGVNYFVIDLGKVEIINSSGLGMLVGALSNLKKRNTRLVLTQIPEKFINLLTMTHLNQVFKLYDSEEEAIKAY